MPMPVFLRQCNTEPHTVRHWLSNSQPQASSRGSANIFLHLITIAYDATCVSRSCLGGQTFVHEVPIPHHCLSGHRKAYVDEMKIVNALKTGPQRLPSTPLHLYTMTQPRNILPREAGGTALGGSSYDRFHCRSYAAVCVL